MLPRTALVMVIAIGGVFSLPHVAAAADNPPAGGWYAVDQTAAAIAQAKKLDRPVAVLWYLDVQKAGPVGQWIDGWKRADLPKSFVCIEIVSKTQNGAVQIGDQFLIKLLTSSKIDPHRLRPPYVLLGNADAASYGVIETLTSAPDAVRILRAARAKRAPAAGDGSPVAKAKPDVKPRPAVKPEPDVKPKPDAPKPVPVTDKATQALATARRLWSARKFTEAMVHYRKLALFAKAKPETVIVAELEKDEPAISEQGAVELEKARRLLAADEFAKAVREARRIHTTYKGFETSVEAKALFDEIKAAHKARVADGGDDKPRSTRKKKASLWYDADEQAEAFERAAMLGRPVVLLWHIKGESTAKVREWKRSSDISKSFVGILLPAKIEGNMISINDPFLQAMYSSSGIKGGLFLPYAFFGTTRGECFSHVLASATSQDLKTAVRAAVKKYGPIPNARQALTAWKRLRAARKLWKEKKFDKALAGYRKVMALKTKNPRLPILAELNDDVHAINRRGFEELQAAEKLLEDNKLDQAKAKVSEIYGKYKGFDTAKDAKELYAKVRTALKERAIATKEIGEVPRSDKPAANDKPVTNDKPDTTTNKESEATVANDKNQKEDDTGTDPDLADDF